MAMMRRTGRAAIFLNVLQLGIDASACLLGFFIAIRLYRDTLLLETMKLHPHSPTEADYYVAAGAFTAVMLLSFAVKHLYQSRETGLMNMDEATSVLQGLFFSSLVIIGGSHFLIEAPKSNVSRLIVGTGVLMGCVLVVAGRALGFKLRRYLQLRGHFFRRVVICGTGDAGRTMARKLLHSPKFHVLPVAFLDPDPEQTGTEIECLTGHEPIPVAGTLDAVEQALRDYRAEEVWIALASTDQDLIMEIARKAGEAGVPCRFVPHLYAIPLQTLAVETLGGVPLLSIKPRAPMRPIPVSKRAFDVVFSLLVLLLSLPFWPFLALLIKITSRGPLFFQQARVGQGGRPFTMYKFRTMYVEAPAYARTPRHAFDRRITPVGRWLRRLSVDELPQFWNVLKGDMSVVGPRPEMPQIVAQYTALEHQRLSVKPGITGIWQISADRKNPIHENLEYDLYYIEKQSFFLDLMIILSTGVYGARGV